MMEADTIHVAFMALSEYEKSFGQLPIAWDKEEADAFIKVAKDFNQSLMKPFEDLNEDILRLFSFVSRGNLCPLQSVIGGIVAQEVIKACSGKFHPILQSLYFDCREILPENYFETMTQKQTHLPTPNRYLSQISILGTDLQNKIENSKCFLVGSGALGCEYIKNFAMMGLCSGNDGLLTVTDMDTIEKSNLNRQFLFRSWDVNKPKAEVSSKAAKNMNPNMKIHPSLIREGPETETIYNEEFYKSLDFICNALDNVKARLYIDSRCIEFKKPLIESGTLGTKANSQVILPDLTESYGSSQDPPEKAIPICTLKNFPSSIEHTIQWARDMFAGLFSNPAISALNYIKDPNGYLSSLNKLQSQQRLDELHQLENSLINEKCSSFEECVKWARLNWETNFNHIIKQLIFNFPPDQKTSNGMPFWSGPKRCPHPLRFDLDNPTHIEYVYAAANLKAFMNGIEQVRDKKILRELVKFVDVYEFVPKTGVKIKVNETEETTSDGLNDEEEKEVEDLMNLFKNNFGSLTKDVNFTPVEFEKDDDTNLHMDFITACSNLRAENYDIQPSDKYNVRKVK